MMFEENREWLIEKIDVDYYYSPDRKNKKHKKRRDFKDIFVLVFLIRK